MEKRLHLMPSSMKTFANIEALAALTHARAYAQNKKHDRRLVVMYTALCTFTGITDTFIQREEKNIEEHGIEEVHLAGRRRL